MAGAGHSATGAAQLSLAAHAAGIWPDVAPGSQLAFVDSGSEGQFWYRASAAQTAFTPLGPRQSAAFSTRFLAIWLDPRTTYPELRQQLIGGTP